MVSSQRLLSLLFCLSPSFVILQSSYSLCCCYVWIPYEDKEEKVLSLSLTQTHTTCMCRDFGTLILKQLLINTSMIIAIDLNFTHMKVIFLVEILILTLSLKFVHTRIQVVVGPTGRVLYVFQCGQPTISKTGWKSALYRFIS